MCDRKKKQALFYILLQDCSLFSAHLPNFGTECCILSVKSRATDPKSSPMLFKLRQMKLVFDKSLNCGVNASRRANSVVIDDASGEPIRVCLKHVYGCLT